MEFQPAFPRAISHVASPALYQLLAGSRPGDAGIDVHISGERLCAPSRIYTDKTMLLTLLSASPADVGLLAACLGTRHHDGYVREACLRQLRGSDRAWVYPFVMALLGDYVIEVAELAASVVQTLDPDSLHALVRDNPAFFATTRCRAISYWNCYHRDRYRNYHDCPPVKTLDAVMMAAVGRVLAVPARDRAVS